MTDLEPPQQPSISSIVQSIIDIIFSRVSIMKAETEASMALRQKRLEARQRIAMKKLQDEIDLALAKEGLT